MRLSRDDRSWGLSVLAGVTDRRNAERPDGLIIEEHLFGSPIMINHSSFKVMLIYSD